jgi:DNA-binding NtrC family response regulator
MLVFMRDLRLLAVDDDELLLASLRTSLPEHWRLVDYSGEGPLPPGPFHAALVDMHLTKRLDRAEGLEVIHRLRQEDPHLEVIAMSGDLDHALMDKGLKQGASRFLAKPLHAGELKLTLDKIEEWLLLKGALTRSNQNAKLWLGSSPAAREVQRQIALLKGERGPILIEGESGTGKELAARLLHAQNSDAPFVAVNMAGLPENLFESEIFGHVRGAFTGADQNKMGLAEAAHGGDLFLDEVEAMPLTLQAKLLRFLETGEVRRVGAKDSVTVHCRVIAATNRKLANLVKEGKFREDLMWRLSGKRIGLPPLRERREDLGELCAAFFNEDPVRRKQLTDDSLAALMSHSWPGNVRELRRVCEQLSAVAPLPIIRRQDVTALLEPTLTPADGVNIDYSQGLPELVNRYEAVVITRCLEQYRDIDEVARVLQISRSSLYKKIKDHNINWRDP